MTPPIPKDPDQGATLSPAVVTFKVEGLTSCDDCHYQAPAILSSFAPRSIAWFLWPCSHCGSTNNRIKVFTQEVDEAVSELVATDPDANTNTSNPPKVAP